MAEKPPINTVVAQKIDSEWRMDAKGYFLIDPRVDEGKIYAHYYNKQKEYQKSIVGDDAESIYYTILREGMVNLLMHAAYIGSELQKAELHLKLKNSKYIQDKPLEINDE